MSSHISGQPVPSLYRFYTIDEHGNQKQDFGYHVAADSHDLEMIQDNAKIHQNPRVPEMCIMPPYMGNPITGSNGSRHSR